MPFEYADRLKNLPPYIFVEVDKLKKKAIKEGKDLVNFGVGDPDLPTPKLVIDALCRAAKDAPNHRYPDGEGLPAMRQAVADYYQRRFDVKLDPDTEVTTLIGSKEGIAHIPLAFIDRGDVVAFPDPGYPVYHTGTMYAGGESYRIFLDESNKGLPDLDAIPSGILKKIKILWVNYPHSPTAAVAPKSYLKKIVDLARKHGFIICSDAAYIDIFYDGVKPPSMLEIPGARSCCLEFYSCSKSFNMTGWRAAFAVGNKDLVTAIRKTKNNIDSGQFNAVQYAAIAAFENAEKIIEANNKVYQKRRDLLIGGLNELGWDVKPPAATFYVWLKTRGRLDSMAMTKLLLEQHGIVTTPGIGLGQRSDEYVRLTLTATEERIKEALRRLKSAGI